MHKLLITVFFAGTNYVLSENNTLEGKVETLGTNDETKNANGNESSFDSDESTVEDCGYISGEKTDYIGEENQKTTSTLESGSPYDVTKDSKESESKRYDEGYESNETEESERSDESASIDQSSSIIENLADKADSVLVFFDWIFQKVDDKVNALNERISDVRTRLPGVTYGGSIMTAYYTMIPLFYYAKDVFNKMLSCGSNIRLWLRGGNEQSKEKKTAYRQPYYKNSRYKRRRRRPINRMIPRKPRVRRKNRNKRRGDTSAKTVIARKRLQIHN